MTWVSACGSWWSRGFFSSLPLSLSSCGTHPAFYEMVTRTSSPGISGRAVRLTTHISRVPRSRMSGASPLKHKYLQVVCYWVQGQKKTSYDAWLMCIHIISFQETFRILTAKWVAWKRSRPDAEKTDTKLPVLVSDIRRLFHYVRRKKVCNSCFDEGKLLVSCL
jgi:hypothetical protein